MADPSVRNPPLLPGVDGVLNVLGPKASSFAIRSYEVPGPDGQPCALTIRPEIGDWLHVVGLPGDLDQVWFPQTWIDVPLSLCRKTEYVRLWASARGADRLAWVDDEIGADDAIALEKDWSATQGERRWVDAFRDTAAMHEAFLVATDPDTGLTRGQVERLLEWRAVV